MAISRNEFLKGSIAMAVGVVACSDDDDDSTGAGGSTTATTGPTGSTATKASGATTAPTTTGGMVTSCTDTIGANHPPAEGAHELTVTAAEVNGGAAMDYDIMGESAHTHMVSLSATDMATLVGGGTVMVTSTLTLGHTHPITVTCT